MSDREVAALYARIANLSPAEQLRLAAGLLERGGPEHLALAGTIARRIADEIALAELLGKR
jgi:hypothetical protein